MSHEAPNSLAILEDFPVGTVFAGKYCVERLLGRGGMGAVLAARHMDLGHRVAIKVLHESLSVDLNAAERFQREARASAALESEHVAQVIDVGVDHDTSYMIMEFLEGEDLASVLSKRGRIEQEEAVSWILEACDAVAEAHTQGIIHRDLKPANLFLARRKRGQPIVKVLDFGISKATLKSAQASPQKELTETQMILGTPVYASPEQLRGSREIDTRTDIWSLGVVLHRLLTGARPFEAETTGGLIAAIAADDPQRVREIAPEVSPEIETIILRCLEKDPDHRYRSVAALARALSPFARPNLGGLADRIAALTQSLAPEASTKRPSALHAPAPLDLKLSPGPHANDEFHREPVSRTGSTTQLRAAAPPPLSGTSVATILAGITLAVALALWANHMSQELPKNDLLHGETAKKVPINALEAPAPPKKAHSDLVQEKVEFKGTETKEIERATPEKTLDEINVEEEIPSTALVQTKKTTVKKTTRPTPPPQAKKKRPPAVTPIRPEIIENNPY